MRPEDLCGAEAVHEGHTTVCCTRRVGHPGLHMARGRAAMWEEGGPIQDLAGRPWLLGTLPPERPWRRRPTWRTGRREGAE